MHNLLLPMMSILFFSATASAEAIFIKDKHDCQLMAAAADETLTYDWNGKCTSGYAEGPGVLLINRQDKPAEKEKVTFRKGMREGHSVTDYLDAGLILRSDTEYAHGQRHGKSVTHLSSGDVLEQNYVDGVNTKHFILTGKDGSRIEGDEVSEGNVTGKQRYANGDEYEGAMTYGTRNGLGKFTRKSGQPQVGEFILDEFVDVKDEAVNDLMPATFGLALGMTKKQVEALAGTLEEDPGSSFRNAYGVNRFPNEKIAVSNMTIGKRTVYFDEDGKLWRIWAEILLKENTYFGGAEVMQAYGTIKRWQSLRNVPVKSLLTFPHYHEGLSSCRDAAEWEKDNPESYNMAQQLAPDMAHSQRVIFDIGCGAIKPWLSVYMSKDGKERYTFSIRYGNLIATPLAYSAAISAEEEMGKKMWKTAQKK